MIDREKLGEMLDAADSLEDILNTDITVYSGGSFRLWVSPKSYSENLTEEQRHRALAILTPLVGKMTRSNETDYTGAGNNCSVYLNRASECKILGYKKVTKTVQKEIERPVEYEEVEEEVNEPITDCDIKAGRATVDEIEILI